MPCLPTLRIHRATFEDSEDLYAALRQLTGLRELDLTGARYNAACVHAALQSLAGLQSFAYTSHHQDSCGTIAQLTQLRELSFYIPYHDTLAANSFSMHSRIQDQSYAALQHLTGLTTLAIKTLDGNDPRPEVQSQLAVALAALTQLQRLELPRVWPGGSTASSFNHLLHLTQLTLSVHQPVGPAIHLPSVQLLSLMGADAGFAADLQAPCLRVLRGCNWGSGDSGAGKTSQATYSCPRQGYCCMICTSTATYKVNSWLTCFTELRHHLV
jgi:hypothetical protein